MPTALARLPAAAAGFVAGSGIAGLLGYRVDWLPAVGGAGWDWQAATLAALGCVAALGLALGVLPDDAWAEPPRA